jgi:hypothetical protein
VIRKQRKPVNTDKQVATLKAETKKYAVKVKDVTGLYLRVTPNGFKSYAAVALDPHGKQVWATLGGADVITISDARDLAREVILRIKGGEDPFPPPPTKPDSFKDVAENYLRRHVQTKGLRSEGTIRQILGRYIYPTLGDFEFEAVKKSDVSRLLDAVEDGSGGRTADYCLSVIRQVGRWYASRTDDYICPFTGAMRRTDPKEHRRKRILNDDEIRLLWAAADGTYGDMARFALLTGQRLRTITSARRSDIDVGGIWTIPQEERQKGHGEVLPLPDMAVGIIRQRQRANEYIFAGLKGGFKGFAKGKSRLDAAIAELNGKPIPHWVFHDLRRTSRSLLSRAGVMQEHAERVLGHAQGDLIQVYDQHDYEQERGEALRKLEALVKRILDPPEENVVSMEAVR